MKLHLPQTLQKKIIFVFGKGGVGKSCVSRWIAESLAGQKKNTLLVHTQQILGQEQTLQKISQTFSEIFLHPNSCFKEYVGIKLKAPALAKILLNNKLVQYLQNITPGIKEIVVLGKIWYESRFYDHIVVDMASTGHALTMLNAPKTYLQLFESGYVFKDCEAVFNTLEDKAITAFINIALAEEMSLSESFDAIGAFEKIFTRNKVHLILNRKLMPFTSEDLAFLEKNNLSTLSDVHLRELDKQQSLLQEYEDDFKKNSIELEICEGFFGDLNKSKRKQVDE